jgi:BirA family biotin operon repressor/biotin-[acetyl-CoA-carboxylase] ligase
MKPTVATPSPILDSLSDLPNNLSTTIFGQNMVEIYDCLDSTNLRAKELGRQSAPEGALVVADQQTGGRGRLGRTWHSPSGSGLYFSLVLRPAKYGFHLPLITLATGLGVARGLERVCGLRPGVKWPNDLLLGSLKCCGILAETEFPGSGDMFTVLGIGINVNQTPEEFPPPLSLQATSIMMATGKPWNRVVVLSAVLAEVESNYLKLAAGGEQEIVDEYKIFCVTLGKSVEVRGGPRNFQGMAVGIEATGQLLVREHISNILYSVDAGEVTISGGPQ